MAPNSRASSSSADILSPTPSLEAIHLAHKRNILALERSAEEISQDGSDLEEEIRRMMAAASTPSRNASQRSGTAVSHQYQYQYQKISAQSSRALSNSYSNTVDDARWGGYSSGMDDPLQEPLQEGRPLDSPLAPSSASLYSQEHAMSRQASQSSFARRYDQIAGQIDEPFPPTFTPQSETIPEHHQEEQELQQDHHDLETEPPERPRSADTFQQAETAFKDFDGVHFNPETEEYVAVDGEGNEIRRIPARSSSGSLLDAAMLLRSSRLPLMPQGAPPPSEGMVYYPAPVPRMLNMPVRLSMMPSPAEQAKRRTKILNEVPPAARQSAPWISPLDFDEASAAQSPPSPQETTPPKQRSSGMLNQRMGNNLQNLPPQLRASIFFDPTPVAHNVEVKSASAVATLDSILAASATAPVTAFTDHPYAGDVRQSVYAMEKPRPVRKSTATTIGHMATGGDDKSLKKRRSSIGNFFRRNSTGVDGELKRVTSRGSAMDLGEGVNGPRRRQSQLSLGDELARENALNNFEGGLVSQAANTERMEGEYGAEQASERPKIYTEGEQVRADFEEAEALSDVEETDPVYVQPSTLLAELQVRKAQLKSRNRTAATAYPKGMHSTLLQLDAVEQIEMKKRQKSRIALAWEDPNVRGHQDEESEDEDVPLGVLYPAKEVPGQRKYGDTRPIGLMERREMEDNEPLSARMARLNPNRPQRRPARASQSMLHLAGQPDMQPGDEAEGDGEGETLAQRQRRLQTKDALDTAISDIAPKPGSRPISTFSADVLSQFGGLDAKDRGSKGSEKVERTETPDEDETLGQRRARLQRERSASGEVAETDEAKKGRPALRSTNSMGNILAANPIRPRIPKKEQEAPPGTLLYNSTQNQAMQREKLRNTNLRSAGLLNDKPSYEAVAASPPAGLFPGHDATSRRSTAGLLASQRSRPANGQFGAGMYNQSMGFPAMPNPNSMFSFASPTAAAMGYAGNMGMINPSMMGYPAVGGRMPGYAQPQQQPAMVNPSAYYGLNAGAPSVTNMTAGAPSVMNMGLQQPATYNPMGAGGMQYGAGFPGQQAMPYGIPMGMNMDLPLDPNQRAAIDRWRMGIA
ncbi:unnamed protein product [Zymoseptoria tritici ST99CH_3D1]|nr:unnamed protein product [Zymoseptoria tritici ST99CH_3D1]